MSQIHSLPFRVLETDANALPSLPARDQIDGAFAAHPDLLAFRKEIHISAGRSITWPSTTLVMKSGDGVSLKGTDGLTSSDCPKLLSGCLQAATSCLAWIADQVSESATKTLYAPDESRFNLFIIRQGFVLNRSVADVDYATGEIEAMMPEDGEEISDDEIFTPEELDDLLLSDSFMTFVAPEARTSHERIRVSATVPQAFETSKILYDRYHARLAPYVTLTGPNRKEDRTP